MSPVLRFVLLLSCPNVFMTFAWYAHLRNLSGRPWPVASCGIHGAVYFVFHGAI